MLFQVKKDSYECAILLIPINYSKFTVRSHHEACFSLNLIFWGFSDFPMAQFVISNSLKGLMFIIKLNF